MDIEEIKKNYQSFYDEQLIDITGNKDSLRPEAIVVLKEELEKRGLKEGLSKLRESKKVSPYAKMSMSEIQSVVTERMMMGEPFESVISDLKANGVNVNTLLHEEAEMEEYVSELLIEAKKENLSEEEIREAARAQFNLNEEEINEFRGKIQSRGKGYVIIGIIMVVLSAVLLLITMNGGRSGFKVLMVGGLGIGLIIKGISMKGV